MPSITRKVRYAIYTRQSTEPLEGLSSCEAQFQVCRAYAEASSRAGDEWVGERFEARGTRHEARWTGTRPAFWPVFPEAPLTSGTV